MNNDRYEDIENITHNIDQRKPVFVDDKGQLHDVDKLGQRSSEEVPLTQIKSTTWF